jgi:hypothetical protein
MFRVYVILRVPSLNARAWCSGFAHLIEVFFQHWLPQNL